MVHNTSAETSEEEEKILVSKREYDALRVTSQNVNRPSGSERMAVFVVGSLLLVLLVWVMVEHKDMNNEQMRLTFMIAGIAGAGFMALVPGHLDTKISTGANFAVSAGGAAAALALALWVMPSASSIEVCGNLVGLNGGKLRSLVLEIGKTSQRARQIDDDTRRKLEHLNEDGKALMEEVEKICP